MNKIESMTSWNVKSNSGYRHEDGLFIAQLFITRWRYCMLKVMETGGRARVRVEGYRGQHHKVSYRS